MCNNFGLRVKNRVQVLGFQLIYLSAETVSLSVILDVNQKQVLECACAFDGH